MRRVAFTVLTILTLAAITACATVHQNESEAGSETGSGLPADFALDVTVLNGAEVAVSAAPQLRRSRYALFADGSLHFDMDDHGERGADWLPPLTRVLRRTEMAHVWALLDSLGFTACAPDDPQAVNFNLVRLQADERAFLIGINAHGERFTFVRRGFASNAADPAALHLLRHLAQLAWAADAPLPQPRQAAPRRYDFGADPYARYRRATDD